MARFKGREGIYGYDLMNEPVQRTEALSGWDWTYHAFRESIVWDVEKAGNDWKGISPSVSITRAAGPRGKLSEKNQSDFSRMFLAR